MEFSPQHNLLFLRTLGGAVHVIDVATQISIDLRLANYQFNDFDLTPDERYLFVADYGGSTGNGQPLNPSWVHRFDLVSRTWELREIPQVAFRIEAVSDSRYLLVEDRNDDLILNSWGSTSEELDRINVWYNGDFEYDHRTGRIYHGNSGSSSHEIIVRRLVGDELRQAVGTGTYGSAQDGGGTAVLSSDGQQFYYGPLQVEALDVTNNLNFFAEKIYAATGDFAFGEFAFYSSHDGAMLGSLGFSTQVYAVSDDGEHVWAFDPSTDELHRYVVLETVATDDFLVTRGVHVSGGLEELSESDNQGVVIRRSVSDTQSVTEFEIEGAILDPDINWLEFILEAKVFARSEVIQQISLYNFIDQEYEVVDSRPATPFIDQVISVEASGNISRYIDPDLGIVRAKVRFQSTNSRQQFSSIIDNTFWTVR